jgi:outer membrane protein assembly factor BamD (BamD/ComL family)
LSLAEPAPSASERPPAASRLAEEARSLESARRELAGGRAGAALATLDRYEREHAAGELRPEATALRVEALAASGDAAGARALGQAFLARHPAHPAAARVRRALGSNP